MIDNEIVYRIKMPVGADIYLARDKILHVPGLGFDGFLGYSVVAMARKSIGLGMAMETFGSRFFGEGTHPGVIVEHPTKLSPEAHSNLKKSLSDTYSGLGNTHRLMLLEEGMKFQKIVIDPKDSPVPGVPPIPDPRDRPLVQPASAQTERPHQVELFQHRERADLVRHRFDSPVAGPAGAELQLSAPKRQRPPVLWARAALLQTQRRGTASR